MDPARNGGVFVLGRGFAGQEIVISPAGLKGTAEGAMAKPAPGPGVVSISDFKVGPETVVVSKGQTTQFTLAEAGISDCICGLHPAMKGKME